MTYNKGRILKGLSVAGVLALCLLLTGCVVPPDDIDAAGDYVVNDGNFQNIAPPTRIITDPPPTDTPAPAPSNDPTNIFSGWGGGNTAQATTTLNPNAITVPNTAPAATGNIVANVTPPLTTSKPTATSGTLKHGSSGSEVRKLQQRLKELGYYTGSVDGDFGDGTEAAVKAFQRRHDLTADGKAGSKTLTKLYSSSALKANTATNTPRRTATPTPRATSTPNLSSEYYLEVGSSGSRVRVLQNRLIELGWMDGKADGSYGGATEYAVRAFQKRYSSLYEDGVAGPSTLKTLYSAGAAKASKPVSSLGETLEVGDENDAVRALQTRLKDLGFLTGKADGSFGEATKAAVIAFQTANNLKADGRAGTGTLNKLYSADARSADSLKQDEKPEGGNTEDDEEEDVIINGYLVLKEGSRNEEVKKLQRALKNRGYFSNSITGYFGENTKAAVMAFQKNNGITADGVAGPATQRLLYNTSSGGNTGNSGSNTTTTLRPGDSGTEVKNMQYTLRELGYFDGSLTGNYGQTTQNAVREFQIRNDIDPVDGIAGTKTLQVLYSNKAISASASTTKYTALDRGDKGDLVVQLQEQLMELGYLSEPTGYYDAATEEAVRNFQRRNNLEVDGDAGQETLRLLYTGKPKTAY